MKQPSAIQLEDTAQLDTAQLDTAQRPISNTVGWDVLLLAVLLLAHLQINSLAEAAALPNRVQDVLRHPFLGSLISEAGMAAMGTIGPRPGDPIGLLLNAIAIGLFILYALTDLAFASRLSISRWQQKLKWILLSSILICTLLLPTTKLILLRDANGPASYTHDGGVIQTEATIEFFLASKNPYVEDYTETPMAEWGFSEYRTALYHYPYLPWTFLFSTPFYLLGQTIGFYDQRIVYLLLVILMLAVAPTMIHGERRKLAVVVLLGLNPIMALDIIFGQNDSFVLAWILFSLAAWHRWQRSIRCGEEQPYWRWLSTILFGLACASKPTAWFFAPFYGLLLVQDLQHQLLADRNLKKIPATIKGLLLRVWPALFTFCLILLPYLLWDSWAFYDDVWRWSSGQGETGYQIWGWGASNFVLALGLVTDRFGQWPFWQLEIILSLPLLLWFLYRQWYQNTVANACWHYGLLLLVFFYSSRFLNENYLGYILAFMVLGWLTHSIITSDSGTSWRTRSINS